MDEEEADNPKIPKSKVLLIFSILLTISYIASTFAANITLNTNNRVEFGQGVYNLKACDDFINLSLGATAADTNGISKVNRIFINGFDKSKCKNRNFTIKIFKVNSSVPENLFNIGGGNTANRVKISVSDAGIVSLINMSESDVGSGDSYHSLSYSSGTYTVTFVDPLLSVPDVSRTTIESANNPAT